MAIYIKDATIEVHKAVLREISNGNIRTWGKNSDGSIFHIGENDQWRQCARFIPAGDNQWYNILILEHQDCKGKSLAQIYGVYHGRLIEMLISHFNKSFSA